MSNINQLDTELLTGYIDNLGSDVVQQMLDLYMQQSAIYISEIGAVLEQQSQTDWQEKCHKMKGAAGSVGLLNVHSLLVSIEKSQEPWEDKKQTLEKLKELNEAAIECFKVWMTGK